MKSAAVGVVYLSLAFSAGKFAMGSGKSSGQQNAGLSAQMMQSGWGKAVLIVVALVLIGVGGYHVYKGATKKFLNELDVSGGTAVTWVGVIGYVAKGWYWPVQGSWSSSPPSPPIPRRPPASTPR